MVKKIQYVMVQKFDKLREEEKKKLLAKELDFLEEKIELLKCKVLEMEQIGGKVEVKHNILAEIKKIKNLLWYDHISRHMKTW